MSRETLLQEVWGYNSGVTTHTLETHIYRLRQKVEKDAAAPAILVTDARRLQAGAVSSSTQRRMTIEDDILFIERVPTLRALGRDALRILAIGAESRYVHKGEVLFVAGEAADSGYVIQEGSFVLESAAKAMGAIVAGPGTLLGRACADLRDQAAGDRDRERAVDRDPHFAQPVPEDAGGLSARRACAARSDRGAGAAGADRDVGRARDARHQPEPAAVKAR